MTCHGLSRTALALATAWAVCTPLPAQGLSPRERRLQSAVAAATNDRIAYLQRIVNLPSNTLDREGVRRVGAVLAASLDSLGFSTRWVDVPARTERAGHLVATHAGRPGRVRMLLIGHLDTVVRPDGASFVREDSMARGIGAEDMKGGDVIILSALQALDAVDALRDLNIILVFTGDEEYPGLPLDTARAALIDAGRRCDVALAFEGGNRSDATVARRGSSAWRLTTTGRQAHSAGVFGRGAGYGAIYELARILDAFRTQLTGEPYLTFNVATVLGGTEVAFDTVAISGTTASKLNIVPRQAVAAGDLRFISEAQKERTRSRMQAIVAQHLPGTNATITFEDGYPAMPPTPGSARLLALYDSASRALGYGPVTALDPGRRGAGDISFVAPFIDGLDGLGAMGRGSHTPDERVDLRSLTMQTQRAALLLLRLGHHPAKEFLRPVQGQD